MDVLFVNLCGFCVGVDCVIEIVKCVIEILGVLIYVCYEVVYNCFVVDDFKSCGVIFVEEFDEVLDNNMVIFSVYGVFQVVCLEVDCCGLKVFDVICLLVIKVYLEVVWYCCVGCDVVLIGYVGYLEVEGMMGQWDCECGNGWIYLVEDVQDVDMLVLDQLENFVYIIQIILLVDDICSIIDVLCVCFLVMQGLKNDDICYVIQNCQDVVCDLVKCCDLVLVVGLFNSFNFNWFSELVWCEGVEFYLIDGVEEIDLVWVVGKQYIGFIVGVLVLQVLVDGVIEWFKVLGVSSIGEFDGEFELMVFVLLKELWLCLIF